MTSLHEENNIQSSCPVLEPSEDTVWKKLVKEQIVEQTLKCPTCKIYSTKTANNIALEGTRCVCGRLARRHSYTGDPETKYQKSQKWIVKFADIVNVTTYGQLANGARVCECIRTVFDNVIYIYLFSLFDVIPRSLVRWRH